MNEILMALATAAALLVPVVVFMILVGFTAVRRGEGGTHHEASPAAGVAPAAEAAAAISREAPRELSVIELLLLGTALFALAMIGLLGVSLLGHL